MYVAINVDAVLQLFRKAQSHPSPAVMAGVTMPCLKILNFLICPSDPKSKHNQASQLTTMYVHSAIIWKIYLEFFCEVHLL